MSNEKHAFRDVGNGMIRDDRTGQELPLKRVRSVDLRRHVVELSPQEWAKLERLAEAQSTPRKPVTPEDCVRNFIANCQPGGSGWKNPGA